MHDERGGSATPFALSRFTDWTFASSTDFRPHRHDYQELLFQHSGSARHRIDGRVYELAGPAVVLISRGEVHIYESATALTGYMIRFTADFLPGDPPGSLWDYGVTPFERGGARALALDTAEARDLDALLGLLEREWCGGDDRHRGAVRHLLAALLIRLGRIATRAAPATGGDGEGDRVYRAFTAALERDFAAHRDVRHYAARLGQSPAALARALREITGHSTKQCIDERIILEARRYLLYTERSVKEIAVALGYRDPFQFSKTFKRLTGEAPAAYRAARRKVT